VGSSAEDHRRIVVSRAGDGDPLLLATERGARDAGQAVLEPHRASSSSARALARRRSPCSRQWGSARVRGRRAWAAGESPGRRTRCRRGADGRARPGSAPAPAGRGSVSCPENAPVEQPQHVSRVSCRRRSARRWHVLLLVDAEADLLEHGHLGVALAIAAATCSRGRGALQSSRSSVAGWSGRRAAPGSPPRAGDGE